MDLLVWDFLNRLESEEESLLAWGITDGGFTREEITERAERLLEERESSDAAGDLVRELRDRRLLFEFNMAGRRLFKTRMAESVRLFARLRQLFPTRNWQISPTLVADYRFARRPRIYPRWHILPEDILARLKREGLATGLKELALRTLLCPPDSEPLKLADFQLRATTVMLRNLAQGYSRGVTVGAGTGTGKTLAFYLPALTQIASLAAMDGHWTKALAIYPRNELLKDQFLETYRVSRQLDTVLKQSVGRKILIGAFFGHTPWRASVDDVEKNWEREGVGYICPQLPCPKCEGQLVWKRTDIQRGRERLQCQSPGCQTVIDADEVVLTRQRMAQTPPDIVFTTTEMLNRQLSNSRYGHVFGIRARRAPRIVLLDEIHTYSGSHGAQVAYLLRRWRRAVGSQVQFMGLSATLRNASDFFGRLVGLHPDTVEDISPVEDLSAEGIEYQLALRGDPVSGTSLLTTTIQSAMLLRRILDPWGQSVSQKAYGRRVFAFTDDLDVTNRLYHNLLDAEGLDSWGRPKPQRSPLAALRIHAATDAAQRLIAGQSWQLCESIGHRLTRPLRVGRTSSQDTGMERAADAIVATASLEVGFNDRECGAVIQHKAPRDVASFLQRKGRAGRSRQMRPWTVVILSDFGRDRIAYQGYDLLFDPLLEERSLPLGNRYVLKMQAVYAFMDWVASRIGEALPKGSVWNDFSGPVDLEKPWAGTVIERQKKESELVLAVLENTDVRQSLEDYLASALSISEAEVQAILWDPPRSLLTGVLPTLLRRLESGWKRITTREEENDTDHHKANAPLPDFIPENLFSDLNLPEVTITIPPQRVGGDPIIAAMPIVQAMREYAPGRVSRRYGIHHAYASHWIMPVDLSLSAQTLPVESYAAEYEEAGDFQYVCDDEVENIRCIRPLEINPSQHPTNVLPTSNAFLDWRTQIVPADEGYNLDLPQGSPWCKIVQEIRYFAHIQRSHVEIRRFAIGSRANLRFRGGGEQEIRIQFTRKGDDTPTAVGFAQAVDGLVFRFQGLPSFGLQPTDRNVRKVRAFRTGYFRHRVLDDGRLAGFANAFQRNWLYEVYLATLTTCAVADDASLADANRTLQAGDVGAQMARVLDVVFQTLSVDEPTDDDDDGAIDQPTPHQPTHEKLLALCRNPKVMDVLADLARVLWEEPDQEWERWASLRFKSTLGGALLQACLQLCPQLESSDLLLDIYAGPRPSHAPFPQAGLEEIWITESTLGGGGAIEEIVRQYTADPRQFFRLAESALEPSDFEIVDAELTRLLEIKADDDEIASAFTDIRTAPGYEELSQASERLRFILTSRGMLVTHPVMTALNARILRPGSTVETDALLRRFIQDWREREDRLGIEIDARTFAYVVSASDELDRALAHLVPMRQGDRTWRFQVINGLLWPRGYVVRSSALSSYNPFTSLPDPDRELLLDVLRTNEERVSLNDPEWRTKVAKGLSEYSSAVLVASPSNREQLKRAIANLIAEPLEIGFLHLYPQLDGFERELSDYVVRLRLLEAVQ